MKIVKLQSIVDSIGRQDYAGAIAAIDAALIGENGRSWRHFLAKLRAFLVDPTRRPRFSIFAKSGNSKLPFLAFSALPGAQFCPGAGDCLAWCYSPRAWRYPAAFCRMVQNSVLLDSEIGRQEITRAFNGFRKLARGRLIDFRLYVDGDFRNSAEVDFWFSLIDSAREWCRAYGYSKSFGEILQHADSGGIMPANYLLNISGGHRHCADTVARVEALPITRGHFAAVSIGRKVKSLDHGTRATNAALRKAYQAKAFTCPGKCGNCTIRGHACGRDDMRGIPIIIAIH